MEFLWEDKLWSYTHCDRCVVSLIPLYWLILWHTFLGTDPRRPPQVALLWVIYGSWRLRRSNKDTFTLRLPTHWPANSRLLIHWPANSRLPIQWSATLRLPTCSPDTLKLPTWWRATLRQPAHWSVTSRLPTHRLATSGLLTYWLAISKISAH